MSSNNIKPISVDNTFPFNWLKHIFSKGNLAQLLKESKENFLLTPFLTMSFMQDGLLRITKTLDGSPINDSENNENNNSLGEKYNVARPSDDVFLVFVILMFLGPIAIFIPLPFTGILSLLKLTIPISTETFDPQFSTFAVTVLQKSLY